MKAHGVCMKGITIRGKANGNCRIIFSLVKPKDAQVHAKSSPMKKNEFINEDVNKSEVINDDIADEIFIIEKFPRKGNKTTPSSAEHDVEELVTHILHDIVDNVKINDHDVKESTIKWNFVYNRIMALDKLYVKALKHNEIMDLPSDVQLLKIMLNVGPCYPKLVKELVVKLPIGFHSLNCDINNDGIAHGLLNFNYKLFAEKHVTDISLPNVHVIDESSFIKILSLQSYAFFCCIAKLLYQVGTHVAFEYA
ncbi:hypothetical protein KIW84_057341 [Lathyrus oleraceus]|uniref:Uncharacterized protein n=1 Tax=Pisum sativum TaxID=3888 RepID=A0A9D5ANQ5_PEA|nr:hypothetical protein KIW84_057341 [Pisum sativum]